MALDYVGPNNSLARELDQVARESRNVADTLRGINLMPRLFPEEALDEICISLSNLNKGTAQGCVEPLNYARHMLPLVRRDHFHIEGEEPELEDEDDTCFAREHSLDHAITRLYVAVGTALDEYRSQAQERYDDYVGAVEIIEFGQDGDFAQIAQKSREVSHQAEQEVQNLSEWIEPNSIVAGNLRRQIQDTANIAHSIQSQIRIRPIVLRWYESAGMALKKLPDVLIATAKLIRVTTDITKIWWEEWSKFKKRLRDLLFDQIHSLTDALQATAERLKLGGGYKSKYIERQRDPEIVDAERQVKELLLSGTKIPKDLAMKAETIFFERSDGDIDRVSDLLQLRNARSLGLINTSLTSNEIRKLGQLSNLTSLTLKANDVSDLSALKPLSNLTRLAVEAQIVTDLSTLGQLSKLTSLTLKANKASDLSPLARLSNLTNLTVFTSKVSDLSPLGKLSNLTSLAVQSRRVSDLSSLDQLSNLINLKLHANEASDLSPLARLSNLTSLTVYASKATDLSPLAKLSNLTSLALQVNKTSDLSPLVELSNLTSLALRSHKITDFSTLGGLSNLTSLSVQADLFTDFSTLGRLSNLTSLSVEAKIVDVAGISELGLRKLAQFKVTSARNFDLAPLAPIASLEKLILSNVTFRNAALLTKVKIELVGNSKPI
jgi:Leucine-rich repeat (LRR) protein